MTEYHRPSITDRPVAALLLGVLILFFDGFDLAVYGVTLPAILRFEPWHVTPAIGGYIGSIAPLGMIPGAIIAGYLSDIHGRRPIAVISLIWVSLSMLAASASPALWMFVAARLSTGFGIGALTPLALAIVSERAPPARLRVFVACATLGLPIGGILANALGSRIIGVVDFRYLYLCGALSLLLAPAVLLILSRNARRDRPDSGMASGGKGRFGQLLGKPYSAITLSLALANLMALLIFYGASVWLPALLVKSGRFDARAALSFGSAFFAGALVGQIAVALIADRSSAKAVICGSFATAALCLALLSMPHPAALTFALFAFLGLGIAGTGTLINAQVAALFPQHLRGSALGVVTAVGRAGAIAGPAYLGLVLSAFDGPVAGFYALIGPALIGVLLVLATKGLQAAGGAGTAGPEEMTA